MKQNGVARAEIEFACAVRYLSHTPESGRDVQIRVALEPDCVAELGTGVRSELFEPPAGNLAGIKQIVFDTTGEEHVAWVGYRRGPHRALRGEPRPEAQRAARGDSRRLMVTKSRPIASRTRARRARPRRRRPV